MFITIRKWTIFYLVCLVAVTIVFTMITRQGETVQASADTTGVLLSPTIVIDPGHGGEDGGAVSSDGTVESHINLSVGLTTAELARFLGWQVILTRDDDISIHDNSAQTLREKKRSDLKNRADLCNALASGLLLSIHQNSLPSAKSVCGAQVFYGNAEGSEDVAQVIQQAFNQTVNTGNQKQAKPIGSGNYLLRSVTMPAVLVECGFLSNEAETQLLKSPDYWKKLALCMISAIAEYQQQEK